MGERSRETQMLPGGSSGSLSLTVLACQQESRAEVRGRADPRAGDGGWGMVPSVDRWMSGPLEQEVRRRVERGPTIGHWDLVIGHLIPGADQPGGPAARLRAASSFSGEPMSCQYLPSAR